MRVCVHAEDGAGVERLATEALAAGRTGPEALPSVRAPSVEAEAVRRAAALAGRERAWLYVVHLSSEAGLDEVRAARAAGVDVHAETCPHYLYLDQSHLEAGQPDFVCAPPLRGLTDRASLWQALGDGGVEVVSTDHCPFTVTDRERGTTGTGWTDFTQIPGGLSSISETRLSLSTRASSTVTSRSPVGRRDLHRAGPPLASTAARARCVRESTPTSSFSTPPPPAASTRRTSTRAATTAPTRAASSAGGRPSPSAAARSSPSTASPPACAPVGATSYDGPRCRRRPDSAATRTQTDNGRPGRYFFPNIVRQE